MRRSDAIAAVLSKINDQLVVDPEAGTAGKRPVRRIDDGRRSENLHRVAVGVAAALLHRDHRVACAGPGVGSEDVLVDVDALEHP